MDLRARFVAVSQHLMAQYGIAAQATHGGMKGSARENTLMEFMRSYLPARYAVGTGQVASSLGLLSRQVDIVIYDAFACPKLPVDDSSAIFPIESVFGAIEVKSDLSSGELQKAYENVASVKRLRGEGSFVLDHGMGYSGVRKPMPWCAVFSYSATRSLKAVAAQVEQLDRDLGEEVGLRPDTVVVLNDGIVAPMLSMRFKEHYWTRRRRARPPVQNEYSPDGKAPLHHLSATGRHTLLRFYLDMLADLGTIVLEEPDLVAYLNAPARMGEHMVSQRTFVRQPIDSGFEPTRTASRYSTKTIEHLVQVRGAKVAYAEVLRSLSGGAPIEGFDQSELNRGVYLHNPDGRVGPLGQMTIDGDEYYFDPEAVRRVVGEQYVQDLDELNAEELFAFAR